MAARINEAVWREMLDGASAPTTPGKTFTPPPDKLPQGTSSLQYTAAFIPAANPRLLSLFPLPHPPPGAPYKNFCEKGGRFGPHNTNQEIHLPDVEKPGESSIFKEYPEFLNDHHARDFVCDTLRTAITGGVEPFDMDQMMERDMEVHHRGIVAPISSLTSVADALRAASMAGELTSTIACARSSTPAIAREAANWPLPRYFVDLGFMCTRIVNGFDRTWRYSFEFSLGVFGGVVGGGTAPFGAAPFESPSSSLVA